MAIRYQILTADMDWVADTFVYPSLLSVYVSMVLGGIRVIVHISKLIPRMLPYNMPHNLHDHKFPAMRAWT